MLLDQSSTDIRLQLNKANFLGRDGFSWWIGQIADLKSTTADEVQLQANESGDPITIIRNSQPLKENKTAGYLPIVENINDDWDYELISNYSFQ